MAGPAAVLDRLIEDDYFQEQLSTGADRLVAAYRRGRSMRAAQAAQDQKLLDQVRGAAASFAEAIRRLTGMPEPEPPRRWRRAPVVLTAVGVAALVGSMHRVQRRRVSSR